jgi:hypothetical protein
LNMDDLKKYMILSEKALLKSLENAYGLGKLSFISDDVTYWRELFTYSEARSALQNFLLYRTAGAFNLYEKGADDADVTAPALNELKRRLYSLPCVQSVKVGKESDGAEKERTFLVSLKDGRSLYLESDTANSLMGDLGIFLRTILKRRGVTNWPTVTYIKQYNLDSKKYDNYYTPFKLHYFFSLISTLVGELQDKVEIDCLEVLEKRAQLTHVLKNMILVPYGYNQFRGLKSLTYKTRLPIQDRLDLTFKDFEEIQDDTAFGDAEFQTRPGFSGRGNKKRTMYSVEFLLENKGVLFPPIPEFPEGAEGNSTYAILERSKIIIKTLS